MEPIKELFKEYMGDEEGFKQFDDEDYGYDKTDIFLSDITEESGAVLDQCKQQAKEIDIYYGEFLKYVGEDIKKLPLEEFLTIMQNFGASLEVMI